MSKKILLINGPNLNLLGKREVRVYGAKTLPDLEEEVSAVAKQHGVELTCKQSNHEGHIIDWVHEAGEVYDGIIMNPGAFTHYSYAIRDAIAGVHVPCIEVHISNVHKREEFRHTSVLAPVCAGQIVGLGFHGYQLALFALLHILEGE
ncbi:type II 3-dehydroquinate dehydratase [Priestia taiwanensis]|uniref:3-dehydroquinate dehydratase n=1 Tax=Priestia taiwanensis TaxID=1347902 RepID=A0A917AT41_9BACI|nr:type II 3-dehydroquinate dehydratase [Priestia taiwanensis]MBM7363830.1 3-dehydroquinate dehydratase-2 [Priestia taiwanensis]GGE73788.1 3-dehydroquinate dehydratase [Priestia taiwanensis]